MMKVQEKRVNFLLLSISLLILVFSPVSVKADSDNQGSLEIKTDRIINGNDDNTQIYETELERTFPSLFTNEIKSQIEDKEEQNEKEMETFEESLFFIETEPNATVQDVKQDLFTENYTAVASGGGQVQEETTNSGLSNTLFAVFTGLAILLAGGIYMMMRTMLD